jgi:hypothetical protein
MRYRNVYNCFISSDNPIGLSQIKLIARQIILLVLIENFFNIRRFLKGKSALLSVGL